MKKKLYIGFVVIFAVHLAILLLVAATATAITDRQRDVVAAVLVAEARGEGRSGMEAVREVIANRARLWHKSEYEVVTQPKQFSCLNGKTTGDLLGQAITYKEYSVALDILKKPTTNRTHGATHYYAMTIKTPPYWATGATCTAWIGKHLFFKL